MSTKPPAKKAPSKKAAQAAPARIGRPPTGSAMSAKDRQAKSLELLRRAGGDKIAVKLPPESVQHLDKIAGARGFTGRGRIKDTIVHALAVTVRALK